MVDDTLIHNDPRQADIAYECNPNQQAVHEKHLLQSYHLLFYGLLTFGLSFVGTCYIIRVPSIQNKLVFSIFAPILIICIYSLVENMFSSNFLFSLCSLQTGVVGRSTLCGSILAIGCYYVYDESQTLQAFYRPALFICALSIFHFSEFVFTALTNPMSLNSRSFLIEHGFEYWIANSMSLIEYTFEHCLFENPKCYIFTDSQRIHYWVFRRLCRGLLQYGFFTGILLVIIGEIIRKLAMVQVGNSFSHILHRQLDQSHKLTTNGLYGFCRHPSYLGWFLWQFGMQLILGVPICLISHTLVAIKFFSERILYEEYILICTYGPYYLDYINRVRYTGIPFVHGTKLSS